MTVEIVSTTVFGFEPAIHGMRIPRRSWDKSDSRFYKNSSWWNFARTKEGKQIRTGGGFIYICPEQPSLGPNDLRLARTLVKRGSSHRKFLRQIMIWVDIYLPRYAWTDVDTYKVGTVRQSESSVNILTSPGLSEELQRRLGPDMEHHETEILAWMEAWKKGYKKAEISGKDVLRQVKRILPEGFRMRSMLSLNYETALAIYQQRENHLLTEFHDLREWIVNLPYFKDMCLTMDTGNGGNV